MVRSVSTPPVRSARHGLAANNLASPFLGSSPTKPPRTSPRATTHRNREKRPSVTHSHPTDRPATTLDNRDPLALDYRDCSQSTPGAYSGVRSRLESWASRKNQKNGSDPMPLCFLRFRRLESLFFSSHSPVRLMQLDKATARVCGGVLLARVLS
jgi:hypothetical protein